MQEKTFTLTLPEGALNLIYSALNELPRKVSDGVCTLIESQVAAQTQKTEE